MSKFKFRLQDLLQIRTREEQERALRVMQARAEAEQARGRLDSLDAVRRAAHLHIATEGAAGTAAGQAQQMALIMEQLDAHIEDADSASRDAEDAIRERLSELTAAARDRLVLDKLRERRRSLWNTEQASADQKLMDEIAVTRFHSGTPKGVKQA